MGDPVVKPYVRIIRTDVRVVKGESLTSMHRMDAKTPGLVQFVWAIDDLVCVGGAGYDPMKMFRRVVISVATRAMPPAKSQLRIWRMSARMSFMHVFAQVVQTLVSCRCVCSHYSYFSILHRR